MIQLPAELVARAKQLGYLSFEQINAHLPANAEPEELTAIADWLESQGIQLIDDETDDSVLPPAEHQPHLIFEPEYDREPAYFRDGNSTLFLRRNYVEFEDAVFSFSEPQRIFDAQLIIAGEQTLQTWLRLRNLVSITQMWPVIQSHVPEPVFNDPEPLDPGHRWITWQRDWRTNRELPMPQLTAEMIRADAQANIALAEKVPPTPWVFRNRSGNGPPPFTTPDTPLEPTAPVFAKLFANDGPFVAHRRGFGGPDYPAHPFVRLRLYPTAVPWEVFAYTWSGGWNECPYPEEQLSMIRHWHGQYGIEPVSHLGDWYEFFVPSPPRSRHQAERLLWEMGSFGEETFYSHGAWRHPDPIEAVRTSHYWYFWWD